MITPSAEEEEALLDEAPPDELVMVLLANFPMKTFRDDEDCEPKVHEGGPKRVNVLVLKSQLKAS